LSFWPCEDERSFFSFCFSLLLFVSFYSELRALSPQRRRDNLLLTEHGKDKFEACVNLYFQDWIDVEWMTKWHHHDQRDKCHATFTVHGIKMKLFWTCNLREELFHSSNLGFGMLLNHICSPIWHIYILLSIIKSKFYKI
jgi:hypothetical protein